MKKRINFAVLFLCFACIFSSCVFYVPVSPPEPVHVYSLTFKNNSSYNVYDWYLKDSNNNNKVKYLNEFYPVYSGCENSINNIPCDNYFVYFSFTKNPKASDYWVSSKHVYINKNKVYEIKNWVNNQVTDEFYNRSVINSAFSESEEKLFLVDEENNVIEFVKAGE